VSGRQESHFSVLAVWRKLAWSSNRRRRRRFEAETVRGMLGQHRLSDPSQFGERWRLLLFAEKGLPVSYRPSAVMRGLTTPVTVAGFLSLKNASQLAGASCLN
jgi:hypothetical protein